MIPGKVNSVFGLGTLIGVFLIVILINVNDEQKLEVNSATMSSQRGIASAMVTNQNFSDTLWKKKIATQLGETNHLPSAKVARSPYPMENLVFGDLKGFYLMKLEGDRVRSVMLNTQNSGLEKFDDIPKYKGDELSFLNKNKSLWVLDFKDIVLKNREKDRSVVALFDGNKNEIGTAEFIWNDQGQLTNLKFEEK